MPADGEIVVFYDAATTPEATDGRNIMQNDQLLEDLAADINETVKLAHARRATATLLSRR